MSEQPTVDHFAEVVLPLAVHSTFSYLIPSDLVNDIALGKRVVVQFGPSRYYTGVVAKVHCIAPQYTTIKAILEVVDDSPIISHQQLALWKWVANYYQCGIGAVMNAALPNAFKLVSDCVLCLSGEEMNMNSLTDNEYLLIETLQIAGKQPVKQLKKMFPEFKLHRVIEGLIHKGIVVMEEELRDKVKPKTSKFISFPEQEFHAWRNEADKLTSRAPKQKEFVEDVCQLTVDEYVTLRLEKTAFMQRFDLSQAICKQLLQKGLIEEEQEEVGRIKQLDVIPQDLPKLSDDQQAALQNIKNGFSANKPVLLHGITGSGKTEVYLHLIQEVLQQNQQVLYLLPEIALTAQLVERIMKVFGNQVAVYHSRFNVQERAEIWKGLLEENSRFKVVIGARSALFLPLDSLGLIIVDEEHEGSFKQHDPSPRYHARDLAVYLAHQFKARIVLGTATPSIESYYNAEQGRYHLVELMKRFSGVALPEVQCADLSETYRKKKMQGVFSEFLIEEMKRVLDLNQQVILFQNRRGFAPVLTCKACGEAEKCSRCDVTYTYHKGINALKCHYCGEQQELELSCSQCGSADIGFKGFGTEKIEEQVRQLFPNKKIARMDLETTRGKDAYSSIIHDFSNRKVDILVGTQMLTKGLDFDHVALVGVLNADQLLNHPDFRAFERAFQLLTQVSGRAGRRNERGKVVIQTFSPFHDVIRQVMHQDYKELYRNELLHRKNFNYPPFYRLINITFKHTKRSLVDECAQGFALAIRAELGEERVLGPEYPAISMINRVYQKHLLIKFERNLSPASIKQVLNKWKTKYLQEPGFKSLKINFDVDPL